MKWHFRDVGQQMFLVTSEQIIRFVKYLEINFVSRRGFGISMEFDFQRNTVAEILSIHVCTVPFIHELASSSKNSIGS